MIKAGLTGGIGSGKSLACEILASFGVPVIDADKIAHTLTSPGGACLDAVRDAFGDCFSSAGTLDRDRLRLLVFSNDDKRRQLENILHPTIRERIREETAAFHAPYCIINVPLLFESNMTDLVDLTVVLDCPETMQVERVGDRSGFTPAETLAIIGKQASRKQKLKLADIVIDNSGDKMALRRRLAALHKTLMSKAANEKT